MTGTNSFNDWLILCQSVAINSNEHFLATYFFGNEIVDHGTMWYGNVIAQSPRKMSLSSQLFQRFIMFMERLSV